MFDGTTTVVDVETLGENSYKLAIKAQELYIAYEVVRRHIDANGARHYSQMIEAKIDSNGYSFTFDTGDVFTAATYDDYPVASSISDTQGGGTGGGVLVVTDTDGTLDKTWQEIHDAGFSVLSVGGECLLMRKIGYDVHDGYYVKYWIYDIDEYWQRIYFSETADGYPTLLTP